ncbi:MAG: aldo/keto reductase [Actinobacteria bacterium]|uniref:Unannotated protein n=1 Tax=freshwater metagenome TaxID=449393 RepID=A0A6J7SCE4_9ZZZZ|nr:aldo/keto reductase [Actinomycetota bacterium]
MKHRFLGHSGLKVSEISYGNWVTHGSQVEEDAAIACVNAALEVGITTFDSADVYAAGRAEDIMGRALQGQRRESLEIFTKVYWPTGAGPNDVGLSRKHIHESINASLRRLRTEYVDLYQAHRFDHQTPLEETMRAFDDLVRAGKVLYVGVSEWDADQIRRAVEIADRMGFDRLISNQPQYSMLYRVIEAEVVPASVELGLGQIVWSPVAQGILTGKYLPGEPPPAGSRATDPNNAHFTTWLRTDEILSAVQALKPLAEKAGLTMAQLAIAWVLQHDFISSAIIGATRPEQVRDNVVASGVTLEPEIMAAIDTVLGGVAVTDPRLTKSPDPRP